jgi:hypothetical protein
VNSTNNIGLEKNKSICNGFGCAGKATKCIQIYGRDEEDDIMLYLCKHCAKMFDHPLKRNSNKKSLERAVQPECSNIIRYQNSNGMGHY